MANDLLIQTVAKKCQYGAAYAALHQMMPMITTMARN